MKIDTSTIIEDLDRYESIVNSSRKIESIRIYEENRGEKLKFHCKEMARILSIFNEDVKELEIQDQLLRPKGFEPFNMMSRVEKLNLHGISVETMTFPQSFRLRLPNLRELKISSCHTKLLEVFERLDDDIILKLTLGSLIGSSQNKYFGNQRSIVNLTTVSNGLEFLDLHRMKLKKVNLQLDESTREKLEGQDEIVEMKLDFWFSHLDFAKFKSLQVLDICRHRDGLEISLTSLDKLPNLRKLKVDTLPSIKSASLQELAFYSTSSEESLAFTAVNCPNIRVLESGAQFEDAGPILLHFPRLESLNCCCKKCSGDAIHQNLKHLSIRSPIMVMPIINRYELLESLSKIAHEAVAQTRTEVNFLESVDVSKTYHDNQGVRWKS
jgi:hypothetical protein